MSAGLASTPIIGSILPERLCEFTRGQLSAINFATPDRQVLEEYGLRTSERAEFTNADRRRFLAGAFGLPIPGVDRLRISGLGRHALPEPTLVPLGPGTRFGQSWHAVCGEPVYGRERLEEGTRPWIAGRQSSACALV